ncbi:MAG TPA: sugar phosphate nucleotidyltransferase [Candidatus Synoicihabitans sp.]|nr:sugar phosphate nucleotidyltransferase [Candidatus Synoicihabitans sp.]
MSAKISQAIITAAGPNQRRLPLQVLTGHDGVTQPAIVLMLQEMLSSGIERVAIIVSPADHASYAQLLAPFGSALTLIEQPEPRGYGHAVWCGRDFAGGAPFLLQVSDHLYVSGRAESCTRQLIDAAAAEPTICSVSAVQATHESQLPFYGTVAGTSVAGRKGVYQIEHVIEKPTPTLAEQTCVVPGLRSGHYLCFFGMHVLTPTVFTLLAEEAERSPQRVQLSPALARLAQREKYLAVELDGRRADLEAPFGLLRAQLALGLTGPARQEVLSLIAEELATDATRR